MVHLFGDSFQIFAAVLNTPCPEGRNFFFLSDDAVLRAPCAAYSGSLVAQAGLGG